MFGLLLIFLLSAASLALLFWLGGLFLQGYFYTQPSEQLYWQAPASGAAVAAFVTLWCALIALSSEASPTNIPYDTLFRFSPEVDMFAEPVKELWIVRKKGQPVRYKRERVYVDRYASRYQYFEASLAKKRWDPNIEAVLLEHNGEKLRFTPMKPGEGDYYRSLVCETGGWSMREWDDGPSGLPTAFRFGRFLGNLSLNFFLLALLFVCFWLVMRFLIGHALLLSFGLWLVLTLMVLPMLFSYAAEVAVRRRPAAGQGAAATVFEMDLPRVTAVGEGRRYVCA